MVECEVREEADVWRKQVQKGTRARKEHLKEYDLLLAEQRW